MSLAIESGATSTVVIYKAADDTDHKNLKRFHFGAANFKLLRPSQLEYFLTDIKNTTAKYDIKRIAIGMPGIIGDQDKKALRRAVDKVWPNLETIWSGNDTETAFACIDDTKYAIKCIVISGTGSCCYGNNGHKTVKIGGYGHIVGDRGSGYAISHMALREALKHFEYHYSEDGSNWSDKSAAKPALLTALLKHLHLQSIYELVSWSFVASKSEIADLAQLVIKHSVTDSIAKKVVDIAVEELVDDIKCLITRLTSDDKQLSVDKNSIQIGFTGSLLTRSDLFSKLVSQKLKQSVVDANIVLLKDTVIGALKMIDKIPENSDNGCENGCSANQLTNEQLSQVVLPVPTSLSLTETRNERSMKLDSMSIKEGIQLMIDEESKSIAQIRNYIDSIEILVQRITHSFKNNGRLFYVGAGTSGRIGVLDASECPPTFTVPPHMVQGIIAGGTKAIHSSIEGAEDSIVDGINAIEEKDITENDVVIGIAACGRTPFVWGALHEAIKRKAYTCLLSFNPNIQPKINLDLLLTVQSGAEVLTGSTRLKAGTATKCILNMLTTLSMVQMGKCFENLMIDLMPSNDKLRDRALRITLLLLTNSDASETIVRQRLIKNNYDIKRTVIELRQELSQ